MLRTALKPKWLALLGLVAVIISVFTWLGLWQLNVSQQREQTALLESIATSPEVVIDEVMPPQTPITGAEVGRLVRATGEYDASGQVTVVGRRLGEQVGGWVLTPLVVETTGARLAVVRGFVPEGAPTPRVPTGTVTVHGSLQPQEGPADSPPPLAAGQLASVDLSTLVNVWPGDVYNGFVFAADEQPPVTDEVTRIPPPAIDPGGLNWRNFSYAIQWWIFAAFVLYVWWRLVRDDYLASHDTGVDAKNDAGIDPDTDTEDRPVPRAATSTDVDVDTAADRRDDTHDDVYDDTQTAARPLASDRGDHR